MPIAVPSQPTRYRFKALRNCENGGCYVDVYLPAPENVHQTSIPVALTYHGGAFTIGDSRHLFEGHVDNLLERGFCVVSAEYRLAPHVRNKEQRQDILDAYKWCLYDLPSVVTSGQAIDPSRMFVFGGSAGATSTIFCVADAITSSLPLPRALYLIYPLVELSDPVAGKPQQTYAEAFPPAYEALSTEDKRLVDEMFAGPIATGYDLKHEHERPRSGRRVWMDMMTRTSALNSFLAGQPADGFTPKHNPYDLLSAEFPPTVLVKAMADTLLPPEGTQKAYEKLKSLGVDAKILEAKDMQHGLAEAPESHWPKNNTWWADVFTPALEFCAARCEAYSVL